MQESIRKIRDVMITINENVNALQEFAPRAETEASLKGLERKLNNLFKLHIQNSLSASSQQPNYNIDFLVE